MCICAHRSLSSRVRVSSSSQSSYIHIGHPSIAPVLHAHVRRLLHLCVRGASRVNRVRKNFHSIGFMKQQHTHWVRLNQHKHDTHLLQSFVGTATTPATAEECVRVDSIVNMDSLVNIVRPSHTPRRKRTSQQAPSRDEIIPIDIRYSLPCQATRPF